MKLLEPIMLNSNNGNSSAIMSMGNRGTASEKSCGCESSGKGCQCDDNKISSPLVLNSNDSNFIMAMRKGNSDNPSVKEPNCPYPRDVFWTSSDGFEWCTHATYNSDCSVRFYCYGESVNTPSGVMCSCDRGYTI